jgi:8-amino-7-oxononanoate synthase
VTVSTTEAISSAGESTFDWIDVRSEARAKAGLSRRLRPRTSDSTDLDLASNDYLGLAKDKRVAGAAAAATLKWGSGSTGSRLVTGSTELHAELEFELANFCGSQSALVFSSGYMANLGAVTALTGPGRMHSAPARFVGISIYAGFFDRIAFRRARSISRGASPVWCMATAQQVINSAIFSW